MIESILPNIREAGLLSAIKQQAESERQVGRVVERATDRLQRTMEIRAHPSRGIQIDIEI